jgi:hypothetical protein
MPMHHYVKDRGMNIQLHAFYEITAQTGASGQLHYQKKSL